MSIEARRTIRDAIESQSHQEHAPPAGGVPETPRVSYLNLPSYQKDYQRLMDYMHEIEGQWQSLDHDLQERLQQIQGLVYELTISRDAGMYQLRQQLDALHGSDLYHYCVPISLEGDQDAAMTKPPALSSLGPGTPLMLPHSVETKWQDDLEVSASTGLLLGDIRRAAGYTEEASFAGVQHPYIDMHSLFDEEHADPGVIFERYHIPEELAKRNYRYRYEEGVSLLLEDNDPVVEMTIRPLKPQQANTITIVGGAVLPGVLDQIEVTERYGRKTTLQPRHDLIQPYVALLSEEEVREIRLRIRQPTPSTSPVAVWSYETPHGTILTGPNPSIERLGYEWDPLLGQTKGPTHHEALDIDHYKLFDPPDDEAVLRILPARRYAVHLQRIIIGEMAFGSHGEWVSHSIPVPAWARRCSLTGLVDVPSTTGDISWIKLEVSFDEGNIWNSFSMLDQVFGQYQSAVINPERHALSSDDLFIHGEDLSMRIKVTMQRPDDEPYVSPSLSDLNVRFDKEFM